MRLVQLGVCICFALWLRVIDEVCVHDVLQIVRLMPELAVFSPPRESVGDGLGLVGHELCISLPTKIHYIITLHIRQGLGVTLLGGAGGRGSAGCL